MHIYKRWPKRHILKNADFKYQIKKPKEKRRLKYTVQIKNTKILNL